FMNDGQLNTNEGSASISDHEGNLLFYTDGNTVYNAEHQIMQNGDGLLGHESSSQSAIITPDPGDEERYYIFAVDYQFGEDGLTYSVVDMNLDNGLGGILSNQKNILLETPVAEKLTATYHENGQDIWVISHRMNNNEFVAYLITSNGVEN